MDPNVSYPTEEKEDDMSNLEARFSTQMRKRAMSAQQETTPGSKVSNRKAQMKRLRRT